MNVNSPVSNISFSLNLSMGELWVFSSTHHSPVECLHYQFPDRTGWEDRAKKFCYEHAKGCTFDEFFRMLLNPKSDYCALCYPEASSSDWLLAIDRLMSLLYKQKIALSCFQDPVFREALRVMSSGMRYSFEFYVRKLVTVSMNPKDSQSEFELGCASIVCARGLTVLPVMLRYKIASFLDFPVFGFLCAADKKDTESENFRHVKRVLLDVFDGLLQISSENERADLLSKIGFDLWEDRYVLYRKTLLQILYRLPENLINESWTGDRFLNLFFLGMMRRLHGLSVEESNDSSLVQGLLESFEDVTSLKTNRAEFSKVPLFNSGKMLALLEQYEKWLKSINQAVSLEKTAQFIRCFLGNFFFNHQIRFLIPWLSGLAADVRLQLLRQSLSALLQSSGTLSHRLVYPCSERLAQLFTVDEACERIKSDYKKCEMKEAARIWKKVSAMF